MKNIEEQSSRGSLIQIFDRETRMHPFACEISFNKCESAMHKELETNLKFHQDSHLITNLHLPSVTKRP